MSELFENIIHSIRENIYVNLLEGFPRLQKISQAIYHRWIVHIFKRLDRSGERGYSSWLVKNELTPADIDSIRKQIVCFTDRPLVSVIMPVFNVAPVWLDQAIQSIKAQIYPEWELCIVDDGSTRLDTIAYLESVNHPRITKKTLNKNSGISVASNTAVEIAVGEYIALMDHDDAITKNALFEMVRAINSRNPDLIYSDEDRIDEAGNRRKPFFKPDWSPDLLRSQNYICHLTVIRKAMFEKVGGFRRGFDGAQDHDLFLRISEKTDRIYHVPKILYSWREIDTSTTINPGSKPLAQSSGLKAVNDHLKVNCRDDVSIAYAQESEHLFVFDARYPLNGNPLVSIIIPTKDQTGYLKNCLDSISAKSSYENYEIIVLNNNSEEAGTMAFLEKARSTNHKLKVVDAPYAFNWSRLNNHGIREANGDLFIFLNNDTEVISKDWMERLAEQALRDGIGAVGPLLLYADGTIQHAGVVVGMGGWADHVFKGMRPQHLMNGFVSPMVRRNVLAVTGSCLVISRKTMENIGPFNEEFTVCGSDVELCLRAHQNGLKNIYDPFVRLYHFESKTRAPENIPAGDFEMSRKHYHRYFDDGDPFYNRNLSLYSTSPAI